MSFNFTMSSRDFLNSKGRLSGSFYLGLERILCFFLSMYSSRLLNTLIVLVSPELINFLSFVHLLLLVGLAPNTCCFLLA